jgi:hypothetical protein
MKKIVKRKCEKRKKEGERNRKRVLFVEREKFTM